MNAPRMLPERDDRTQQLAAFQTGLTALTSPLTGPALRHVLDQAMDAARACVEALASASEAP